MSAPPHFPDVPAMLGELQPVAPVYCVYPGRCRQAAQEFLQGFSGRVLYAVKANNDPIVLRYLVDAGVSHFDCASVEEIRQVHAVAPGAKCYFMNPVRLPGAARTAHDEFGVRHFVVDHPTALAPLFAEIEPRGSAVFVRMAVHHDSAREKLSEKFGAEPAATPHLLEAVAAAGAESALAFNVGSNVLSPEAYVHGIELAADILAELPFKVRLLDIGGGFGRSYPDIEAPPLADYFAAIDRAAAALPLADGAELLAEPGRALAAPGVSAVTRVLLRKEDRVYLNDGMYGALWELRCNGQKRYAVRSYRDGRELRGKQHPFTVFGPTCDSGDRLPAPVELPADLAAGDYVEFESIGAYSLSGRSDFNGFFSDAVVTIGR